MVFSGHFTTLWRDRRVYLLLLLLLLLLPVLLFMPWYFIPGVLKLANRKMYVRNGYDGDSETVNMLARHTALKC